MPSATFFPLSMRLASGAQKGRPVRRSAGTSVLVWMLAGLGGGAQASDALLDFRLFNVPQPTQLVQKSPVVSWLVRPDAERFCADAAPRDGHISRQEGCVYWQLAAGKCTVVTTASTTHSQLGHLFLHCLQGK